MNDDVITFNKSATEAQSLKRIYYEFLIFNEKY